MNTLSNVASIEPAHITLYLHNSITEYKIFGYAIRSKGMIELQPADLRRRPQMVVPYENVAKIVVDFDN
jgi:hypothetical protein